MTLKFINQRETKFIGNTFKHPAKILETEDHYYLESAFEFKDDFKLMQGARWMGYDEYNPMKRWRVNKCRRNDFRISWLENKDTDKDPFNRFLTPLEPLVKTLNFQRPVFNHQRFQIGHGLLRKQCIFACEMGTGKTLSSIEVMERSGFDDWWFIGTKSSIASVRLDFWKWKAYIRPIFMTYEELKRTVENWIAGKMPPRGIVFDECSKLKTPSSQRSQAAFHVAESMRNNYGLDAYILLMSGSPAPKSPLDWYWQCEIACPGFLREGDINKFKDRLAITEQVTDLTGGKFPKFIAWRDGTQTICNKCGKSVIHALHTDATEEEYHDYVPLVDEVSKLYRRMRGLVLVQHKKDCLDLPDKVYREIRIKPNLSTIRAAQLIQVSTRSTIEALTKLRELSDGFQYVDTIEKTEECTVCAGNKKIYEKDSQEQITCPHCEGTGKLLTKRREVKNIESPKYDALTDLLTEDFDDENRIVIYGAFTGTIDRICDHVTKLGWQVMRVDGRGWNPYGNFLPRDNVEFLKVFQDSKTHDQKIAFVGHPGSAGMGLTLTGSKAIIYFSNDFNGESRIQSEDRIHRAGMDVNRGATIIDLLHLPSDEYVLKNLRRKRELQSLSMGLLLEEMRLAQEEANKLGASNN